MKKSISTMLLIQVLLCSAAFAGHPEVDPYALEPSINGGVSASGLFASQEEEDAYLAELALEPCIDGGVSKTGLFTSQAEEDAFTDGIVAN